MTDQTGAVVLLMTSAVIFTAGYMIGGRIKQTLIPVAINVFAVSTIFVAFSWSVEVGMEVRPWAKFFDGIAALIAARSALKLTVI